MTLKQKKKIIFDIKKPPLIIAEISANHCGSKSIFLKSIESAAKSGADLIKIQTYDEKDMVVNKGFKIKSGLWKNKNLYNLYKKAKTPYSWHADAFKLANKKNIILFSTPFSERAVDFLEQFNPPLYKVASFEITDLNLINKIAKTKKLIIISTGLSDINEVKSAIRVINKYHNKIVILHCVSGYPTPIEEINLKRINYLRNKLSTNLIGLSDHTSGIEAASTASALGIVAIEKHFILNEKLKSPDSKFSITPNKLKQLKVNVENSHKMIGLYRNIKQKAEIPSLIFRRSVFAIENINKGEKFSKKNTRCFRPRIGLPAEQYLNILGKKSLKNINKHSVLKKTFTSKS